MTYTLKGSSKNLRLQKKLRSQMTPAENRLWIHLRGKQFKNLKFRRQHGIGPYIVDFFCPQLKLAIEVDGDVHALKNQRMKDQQRQNDLKSLGVIMIRYQNNDIFNNLDGVLKDLYQKIFGKATPSDSPLQKGRTYELGAGICVAC